MLGQPQAYRDRQCVHSSVTANWNSPFLLSSSITLEGCGESMCHVLLVTWGEASIVECEAILMLSSSFSLICKAAEPCQREKPKVLRHKPCCNYFVASSIRTEAAYHLHVMHDGSIVLNSSQCGFSAPQHRAHPTLVAPQRQTPCSIQSSYMAIISSAAAQACDRT